MDTEVFFGDGNSHEFTTDLSLVDCRVLYPDLVTGSQLVAGEESTMYCFDDQVAQLQGMELFKTHTEIIVSVRHCN